MMGGMLFVVAFGAGAFTVCCRDETGVDAYLK